MNRHEALTGYPVVVSLPLLWGDEDSFGHVNNTVYLRWCETARVEYFKRIGLWHLRTANGTGPILAAISCDFRRPLNYPDTVLVGARVTAIGRSSFRMEHRILSQSLETVAAEASSTIVVFDYTAKKAVRVPPNVRKAIEDLEQRVFEPANGRPKK